jgi:aminopeptidase N
MKILTVTFWAMICLMMSQAGVAQHIHQCAASKIKSQQYKRTRVAPSNDEKLMAKYDVNFYELDLEAENDTLLIAGNVSISSKVVAASLDTFAIELYNTHTLDSILYNGIAISSFSNNNVRYGILPTLPQGTAFTVQVFYHGVCPSVQSAAIGGGYSTDTSPSWGNSVSWSLSQPYAAYEWWPCKQALTDKADSCAIHVTTTLGNRVASQGLLQSVDTLTNGKVKYNWKSHEVVDYYLISIAVAQYVDYSTYVKPSNMPNGDSILYQNYIYNNPGTLPNFKNTIDTCALMLKVFSEKISLYPFHKEKYGHAMAPFGGGMEHQTMSSLGSFNFDLVAHELFHQWFGDHVTCATWKDIFVNEGFASYGEYLAREWLRSQASAASSMRATHNAVKTSIFGSVHFTDTADVNRIFSSRLTYDKGAAIIHTLRYIIGDSAFFNTLRQYQSQYAYGNATSEQFITIAEQVSGQNLDAWKDQWYYGQGWPIYSLTYNNSGNTIVLNLKHTAANTITPLFTNPIDILLKSPQGDTTVRLEITSKDMLYTITSEKIITGATIDPANWVIDSTSSVTKNELLFPTGLAEIALSPNPIINQLHVLVPENMLGLPYKIINVVGKEIMIDKITSTKFQLQLQDLPSGNYWFVVAGKGKIFHKE